MGRLIAIAGVALLGIGAFLISKEKPVEPTPAPEPKKVDESLPKKSDEPPIDPGAKAAGL